MSEYAATVRWQRQDKENYIDNQYSRGHEWMFDDGVEACFIANSVKTEVVTEILKTAISA